MGGGGGEDRGGWAGPGQRIRKPKLKKSFKWLLSLCWWTPELVPTNSWDEFDATFHHSPGWSHSANLMIWKNFQQQ